MQMQMHSAAVCNMSTLLTSYGLLNYTLYNNKHGLVTQHLKSELSVPTLHTSCSAAAPMRPT